MNIQDDRGSRKKAWKAFQANYDDVFGLSDRLCSYCLTDQMVQALLTLTEFLKWPTRWVSETTEIDRDKILLFATQLEYRLMNGCCDDNLPIQWQYTADGTLQQSLNGGSTWVDAPLYDPRVYSPTFPPAAGEDGDDKKCVAATGMVALIKEQVGDQLTDDMSRYTLGQLITDWVKTLIQSSNPFEALLTVVTNQIFALIIATLRPALTDTVYDTLQCIFYCDMADDASFTTEQWQKVRSDITDQIGGIAGIFLEHLCYLLGEKGLTNLARAGGASTGDCSDCPDCDTTPDVYISDLVNPAVQIFPDDSGVYTAVQSGTPTGDGFYWIVVQFAAVFNTTTYEPCNGIGDIVQDAPYREQFRCHDGVSDPLAGCCCAYSFRYGETGHTVQFTLNFPTAPCT